MSDAEPQHGQSDVPRVQRRDLLKAGLAATLALSGTGLVANPAAAQGAGPQKAGSTNIVRSVTPPIEETRVDELEGLITPTRNFYVRNHFAVPEIDPATWSLHVEGHVDTPFTMGLAELRNLSGQTTLTAFLECAGNGRGRFDPPAEGTAWIHGGAGTAEWTGVPLARVLERAGVRSGAVDVVAEGGDSGRVTRGLPLDVAMQPDTLVVWAMNGEPLVAAHGAPVRLFVAGWVGVASIKWLQRLEVTNTPFDGFYNVQRYIYQDRPGGAADSPAQVQPVKSFINRPEPDGSVSAGRVLVTGYAWSGYGEIETVEVSVDGGVTWAAAQIQEPRLPRAWVRFEFPWEARPGSAVLVSRATDRAGHVQPATQVEWNRQGYHMNTIYRVPVSVA